MCTDRIGQSWESRSRGGLLPQIQFFDQHAIIFEFLVLEIIEQFSPAPDELQQPAPGGMVFFVSLKMFREHPDPLGEERDLNFRRTGILVMQFVLVDYFLLMHVR